MKAQAKLFIPVHVIYVFIAYASSKWSGKPAIFAQSRQSLCWLYLKEGMQMKAQAKLYIPVHVI